jgi:hypothetical protein
MGSQERSGALPRGLRFTWFLPRMCSGCLMALLSLTACSHPAHIILEKEVVLTELAGQPDAIVRTSGSGFVIVGNQDVYSGWAIRTAADGKVLWKFEDQSDPDIKSKYRSAINGVVPLSGGAVLLCGKRSTSDYDGGVIWIVDDRGMVIDSREMTPHGDPHNFGSVFFDCFHWGSEIGLLGSGHDDKTGFFWLVKADTHGGREWERTDPGIVGGTDWYPRTTRYFWREALMGGRTRASYA